MPGKRLFYLSCILSLLLILSACETREQKINRHRTQGLAYLEQGNSQGAVVEFKNLVRLIPGSGEAHYLLGKAYSLGTTYNTAQSEYETALKYGMDSYDLHLSAAETAYFLNDLKYADREGAVCLSRRKDDPRLYLLLGNLRAARKDFQGALARFQKALDLDPNFHPAVVSMGKLYLTRKQMGKALAAFRKARKLSPGDSSIPLYIARIQSRQGKLEAAANLMQSTLERNPGLTEGHLLLGELLVRLGRFKQALSEGEKALSLSPGSARAHLITGAAYLGLKNGQAAVSELLLAIRGKPDTALPYLLLAQAYFRQHQTQQAFSMARRVVEKSPNHAGANLIAGVSALILNYDKEATRYLERAAKSRPEDPLALNLLGMIYLKTGHPDDALEKYRAALRIDPNSRLTHENIAGYYGSLGEIEKAIQEYRISIRIDPDRIGTRIRLILSYLIQKKFQHALAEARVALKLWPDNALLLNLTGEALAGEGKGNQAIDFFNRSITANPAFLAPYLNKAEILIRSRKEKLAEACYNRAIHAMPDRTEPYLYRGRFYATRGALPLAVRDYETALLKARHPERLPDVERVRFELAVLYERTGAILPAMKQYQKILDLHPENGFALNNLAWLYANEGNDLTRAKQLAEKAAKLHPGAAPFLDTLGWIQFKSKEPEKAENTLKKAITLKPGMPILHYHLGEVTLESGRLKEAKRYFQKALKPGKDFPGIERCRLLLSRLSHAPKKAPR